MDLKREKNKEGKNLINSIAVKGVNPFFQSIPVEGRHVREKTSRKNEGGKKKVESSSAGINL